jgi:hypothetical protein
MPLPKSLDKLTIFWHHFKSQSKHTNDKWRFNMEVYKKGKQDNWNITPGPVWGTKYSLTTTLEKWFKGRPVGNHKKTFWLVFTPAEEKRIQALSQKLKFIGPLNKSSLQDEVGLLQTFFPPPILVTYVNVNSLQAITDDQTYRLALKVAPSQY